ANAELARLLGEGQDGDYVEPSRQSVRNYLEKWLIGVELNRKPSTASMYRHKIQRYVLPRIGAMRLRQVDPATLDELYVDLLARGGLDDNDGNPTALSAETVRVVHRILHRAFADAVKRRIIRHNPATDATVPRDTAPRDMDVWNSAELAAFLAYIAD